MTAPATSNFYRLHPRVQQWIASKKWPSLREIQELAIPPILAGDKDVIITAATAQGKTEAAFLPVFSQLVDQPTKGIQVIGLGPLKALINDQHRRLSAIGDCLDVPVCPWHGDISSGPKQRLLKQPAGVLLITPESLEALFVLRGQELGRLFASLSYIVIDEMHSFISIERGRQLQSLMQRVEQVVERPVPRIGLSATLGDMSLAAEFLRPGQQERVQLVQSFAKGDELKLQLRGYRSSPTPDPEEEEDETMPPPDALDIAQHLFQSLRGEKNLIFINSRRQVERYADILRNLSAEYRVPNEFMPHHGSLSKELRAEAEEALKRDHPVNVICTMTLEMGIDVGAVQSIAQIGPPSSVASTRQRLGRSGRRAGDPAIMRVYVSVPQLDSFTSPEQALYPDLVQAIAIINLLLEGWYEPPIAGRLHISTLIQQLLSSIAQQGGIRADQAWHDFCEEGPFQEMEQGLFIKLLRCLGERDLIQQSQDGLLLLGLKGERLVNHYTFYTAFSTTEEYRISTPENVLGTLPTSMPIAEEMVLLFAGRRWQVQSVDSEKQVVMVVPADGEGQAPRFGGSSGFVHDRVRQTMREIYRSTDMPVYLDDTAKTLLHEARTQFRDCGLDQEYIVGEDEQVLLFPWRGSLVMNTLQMLLLDSGLKASQEGLAIKVKGVEPDELMPYLQSLVNLGPANPLRLADVVRTKRSEKYDWVLTDELLNHNYVARFFDPQGTWETVSEICGGG
ncbi:DEAD/DEAH box helicase [Acaryochloris sp. CCMEE 5410]|uniref:DEAD/DEAH box helicase n=1 Tax=Acaryochloris sp. CCMEE 5410 TaxID=310037 RepID=UPI0002484E21|nr:DEAD/DEAH box helicase [Acaryochloris sp. CCMEE 5410]KAI9133873.1 DEAD/DEAH box helicase [Acaryochloris sp. CCMEE 5410]